MSSKSRVEESGDASYTILGGSLLLGVVGAHGWYVISAYAAIQKLKLDNPGRDIQVRINYLNLAHTELLIYGLVVGLILGAVGAVAWKYLSRYLRSAAAKRGQES